MYKSKTKILNGRIILIVLAIIFFTIVIPFIINLCFKFNSPIKILSAEWDAGDFLSYYGTLLFGCIAAYLTYSANNINKRLLALEESNKKANLIINIDNSTVKEVQDELELAINFENPTNNVITDLSIESSDEVLIDCVWKKNEASENTSNVTIIQSSSGNLSISEKQKVNYNIYVKNLATFMLVSFKVNFKNIYGFSSEQYFTLILVDKTIVDYKTRCS
ncbi:hypothetical protein ACRTAL_000267 [Clostridium perfringens]|uniref:hypothetical protein n=2 Tax=Clostridium perfringens TaxID=1502 RepID=UPI001A1F7BB8|nr:hypothetical protein [Clostridium perfringens]MDU7574458.1 hypothetical protein [Clostridioides difficile]EHK2402855.1 hypothetical protein [Clostridium perfringens]MDH2470751.1 hypothetical protein [Clostridium perfringens]MDK0795183.1 hypothetical protein [Clostridium perfringens]MDM0465394.1 hypothetical protein [Clostridium perfringens]